ncbi:hypothetical protein FALBO_1697 [Fusarium albosuccineum]|uniref:Apple domain-containing protein n=1 Tax=Fusarium albosuccineum TaxID=1237068 RepID=A0A8H4LPR8_9HYPO|nr:hypothetical protein FALBO_1697 [Fusarium albosuccineum]
MKAIGVATLLAALSLRGAYAGLCKPSSALSSSTTAAGESSSLTTDTTTVPTSIASTTTSDATTTTTTASAQGTEGPNSCCGYPGYFDGHVIALDGGADSIEGCRQLCTSNVACTHYIFYEPLSGGSICNIYGTTVPFVLDQTKRAIYYPRECQSCEDSQPPPPVQPSCIADIPCRDYGFLEGTFIEGYGVRSVSATQGCAEVCASVSGCTHANRFNDPTYGWRCSLSQIGPDAEFIPGTGFSTEWYSRGCNEDACRLIIPDRA